MSVTIRKAANGYIVSYMPEYNKLNAMNVIAHHPQPSDHVFATSEAMLAFVAQKIVDPCIGAPVEQPQTPDPQSSEGDSTETMVEPAAVSDEDVKWAESEIAKEAAADFDEFSRSAWSHPATAARANGSAEQTE